MKTDEREIQDTAGLIPEINWAKGTDPVSQAHLWTPMRLYDWQCDILRAMQERGARVACSTPNESGKTSAVLPVLGLSWMAAFPGSQVVSTAGVERQIKIQLWPALKASLGKYHNWKITDDLKIQAPSVRGFPGSTWEAFTTKDPDYAEGFHPRWYRNDEGEIIYAPLLIIVDEAKAFNDPELMFVFVNRCSPDALLMISSPGSDSGDFYDACHKYKNDPWKYFGISWEQCPHLRFGFKLQERLDKIRQLGENNPLVMSWLGKFHRASDLFIFDRMEDVDTAMTGNISHIRGDRAFAIDFSGGGDEQAIGQRAGNKILPIEVFHERNDVVFANMCVERFKRWRAEPWEILADNGGAGKTCIDILESRGYAGIKRYMFNAEAKDKTRFKYKAAEDHFELRNRMRISSMILPDDSELKDQMRKRKYMVLNDDNRIQMEPKEKLRDRGEQSPGRLDVVIMLISEMAEIDWTPYSESAANTSRNICPTAEEYMKGLREQNQEADAGGGYWAEGMLMDE